MPYKNKKIYTILDLGWPSLSFLFLLLREGISSDKYHVQHEAESKISTCFTAIDNAAWAAVVCYISISSDSEILNWELVVSSMILNE